MAIGGGGDPFVSGIEQKLEPAYLDVPLPAGGLLPPKGLQLQNLGSLEAQQGMTTEMQSQTIVSLSEENVKLREALASIEQQVGGMEKQMESQLASETAQKEETEKLSEALQAAGKGLLELESTLKETTDDLESEKRKRIALENESAHLGKGKRLNLSPKMVDTVH